jgi:predicted amidohydrolase
VIVACCPIAPDVLDAKASDERAQRAIRSAVGAQIVVLPELATTGYVFRSRG